MRRLRTGAGSRRRDHHRLAGGRQRRVPRVELTSERRGLRLVTLRGAAVCRDPVDDVASRVIAREVGVGCGGGVDGPDKGDVGCASRLEEAVDVLIRHETYPDAPVVPRHDVAAEPPVRLGSGYQRKSTGTSVAARLRASALTTASSDPAATLASESPQFHVTIGIAPVAATVSSRPTSTGSVQFWNVDRIDGGSATCCSNAGSAPSSACRPATPPVGFSAPNAVPAGSTNTPRYAVPAPGTAGGWIVGVGDAPPEYGGGSGLNAIPTTVSDTIVDPGHGQRRQRRPAGPR